MKVNIDDYIVERSCEYKEHMYIARDNGAIMRLSRDGARLSKWDNVWTFGTKNKDNGYMIFTGNVRVHQVVCTAFHGPMPEPNMVVDHIDTNRCNNRPENLRWVTRLENALNNPITRYKIELICGSIEAFVANPALLRGYEGKDPNFAWMRAVTPAEAELSYKNWQSWINSPNKAQLRKKISKGVGEWIFDERTVAKSANRIGGWMDEEKEDDVDYIDSLTPNAKQRFWLTPTEFLLCPADAENLQAYLDNITVGNQFTLNKYGSGIVLDFGYNQQNGAIIVLTQGASEVKPWALCKVTMENGYFVHENCGSFFEEDGGRKYFTIAMGREWTGGNVFDDYCR